MCGIAAILSGIHVSSSPLDSSLPPSRLEENVSVCIDDIKAALRRRGPDSLGSKTIYLCSDDAGEAVDELKHDFEDDESAAELCFIGATLQLRGINPIVQPLVDSSSNVLVFNGEIFGGVHVESDTNDVEILLQSLSKCCSCVAHEHTKECSLSGEERNSVPELLSVVKGPWALIYWQSNSKTMWFGRDAFGRRSLLVHWPTSDDSQLLLSSVSPHSSGDKSSAADIEDKSQSGNLNFWEELSCGVYSLSVAASRLDSNMIGEVKKHEWTNTMLEELIIWERAFVEPKPENKTDFHSKLSDLAQISDDMPAQIVLRALRESVVRRTTMNQIFQLTGLQRSFLFSEGNKAIECECMGKKLVPVAVLFSGGLDSMILASLLDNCLDPRYEIDLLNVSFDGNLAPDRISGRAGLKELERISPSRKWKLVEIEAELSKLESESQHVMSLINPASTYMDLNIGLALWLAAGGDGWLYEDGGSNGDITHLRVKYKSEARILLVGAGADEQCAGYGRHRTRYRNGSWVGLHEEMKLDMQRIWKRNLGRDDRCIADNGKEARFPFLDEDVIKTLLDIPLWEIADLSQPSGSGDKKILREVARLLGLHEAAGLPKRAIQFGSRIARESNRKNFGSNRAANMASAGSAFINRSTN